LSDQQDVHIGRRRLLRALGVGSTGVLVSRWSTPLVDTVVVPLHAQASFVLPSGLLFGVGNTSQGGGEDGGRLFRIDTATGDGTTVGFFDGGATEVEVDPFTGRMWVQLPDGAFLILEINPLTGEELGAPVDTDRAFTGLEFVGGTLYGTSITNPGGESRLRTLNPSTGDSTNIGVTGVGPISGLAWSGSVMYGVSGGGGESNLYTLDLSTGAATLVGPTGVNAFGGLAFLGGVLYGGSNATDGGRLYTIDTATGVATLIGSSGFANITGLTST